MPSATCSWRPSNRPGLSDGGEDRMTDAARFDVIVCGAGMAGLCTAVAALEAGARVLVIEKGPAPGGSMRMSGGTALDGAVDGGDGGLRPGRRSSPAAPLVEGIDPGLDWLRGLGVDTGTSLRSDRQAGVEFDVARVHRADGRPDRGRWRRDRGRRPRSTASSAGRLAGSRAVRMRDARRHGAPASRPAPSSWPPVASRATTSCWRAGSAGTRTRCCGARTRTVSATACSPRWRSARAPARTSPRSTATRCRRRPRTRPRIGGRR